MRKRGKRHSLMIHQGVGGFILVDVSITGYYFLLKSTNGVALMIGRGLENLMSQIREGAACQ